MAATIADVLRHLVKHTPDLYEDGRREFLEAIDAPGPHHAEPAEPEPAGAAEPATRGGADVTPPEPEPAPDPSGG